MKSSLSSPKAESETTASIRSSIKSFPHPPAQHLRSGFFCFWWEWTTRPDATGCTRNVGDCGARRATRA